LPQIVLPNNWQPRWYQLPLWRGLETKRRVIEIAHRRWGKDDVMLHNAAIKGLERPATYWHCLPEYEQARRAIWNAVNPHTGKRRIDEAFPREIVSRRNDNEMLIELVSGSTWQVIGSDRYDSLVGAGVAGVTFSEWALANPSAWGYIKPMVEENNGWAAFITTPRGKNHAKSMLDMALKNDDWFAEVSPISVTKALSQKQLDEALLEYQALFGHDAGQALFDQEYYCSFDAAIPGAYYGREMALATSTGRICDVPVVSGVPVHTVWDLGKGQNMAIWCFQVIGEWVHLVDYLSGQAAYIPDYVKLLDERGYRGVDIVPHDARVAELGTGRTRVETLVSLGRHPIVCPMHKVDDGINAVRMTLPHCRFDIVKTAAGVEALRQYEREWDDKAKMFKDVPRHNWASHPADAFRYLAMSWRKVVAKEPPPPPKNELIFEADELGRVKGNLSIREIVALKEKRRKNGSY